MIVTVYYCLYWWLVIITCYYCLLVIITGYYWILLIITDGYWLLLNITDKHWLSLIITTFCRYKSLPIIGENHTHTLSTQANECKQCRATIGFMHFPTLSLLVGRSWPEGPKTNEKGNGAPLVISEGFATQNAGTPQRETQRLDGTAAAHTLLPPITCATAVKLHGESI